MDGRRGRLGSDWRRQWLKAGKQQRNDEEPLLWEYLQIKQIRLADDRMEGRKKGDSESSNKDD